VVGHPRILPGTRNEQKCDAPLPGCRLQSILPNVDGNLRISE
jgi:hypothetical protein